MIPEEAAAIQLAHMLMIQEELAEIRKLATFGREDESISVLCDGPTACSTPSAGRRSIKRAGKYIFVKIGSHQIIERSFVLVLYDGNFHALFFP